MEATDPFSGVQKAEVILLNNKGPLTLRKGLVEITEEFQVAVTTTELSSP